MHIMLLNVLSFVKIGIRKALLFLMGKNYITFTVPCILQIYDISKTKKAMAKSIYCAMEFITCSLVKLCSTTQYFW